MPAFPSGSIDGQYHAWGRLWGERNFDPAAHLVKFVGFVRDWGGPGAHMTRDSLYFARVLLDAREDAEVARADDIIRAVLATQVTREGSPQLGNFPWAAADPEEKIWDPNWACFNAQTILELLAWHAARLPAATLPRLEAALARCARFDRARWVAPAYTNIALLTTLSLAGAGERLRDPTLVQAGRDKLEEVLACARATGGFDEYNSPTYAAVNLRALASLTTLVRDPEIVEGARELFRLQWALLLERLHHRTGQLAGPHGRAYGRDMLRHTHGLVKFHLHRAFGEKWPLGLESDQSASDLFPALLVRDPDCPEDLKEAWSRARGTATVVTLVDAASAMTGLPEERRFPPFWSARAAPGGWARLIESKGAPLTPSFRGVTQRMTTWLGERWCLGTMSAEAMGDQAVPLIGHWPNPLRRDRANYLVAQGLRETAAGGLEYFPGAVLCCAQSQGRVLGLLRFEADPESRDAPRAGRAHLAFRVNADARPEISSRGGGADGAPSFERALLIRADGLLVGIRVLRARVPGAKVSTVLDDRPGVHGAADGETGAHLVLEPVALETGQDAYVAFALEMTDDAGETAAAALADRLAGARVAGEEAGWLRLAWGGALTLEAGTRVLDCRGVLTPEGESRPGPA